MVSRCHPYGYQLSSMWSLDVIHMILNIIHISYIWSLDVVHIMSHNNPHVEASKPERNMYVWLINIDM